MNRLQELIVRLKEQFEEQAALSQLLATTQLIEAELSRLSALSAGNGSQNGRGSAKVAVMMPSASKNGPAERDYYAVDRDKDKRDREAREKENREKEARDRNNADNYSYNNYNMPNPDYSRSKDPVFRDQSSKEAISAASPAASSTEGLQAKEQVPLAKDTLNGSSNGAVGSSNGARPKEKDPVNIDWSFDPMTDIPTLSQQPSRELNDVIGAGGGSSLNDKHKGNVLDLAAALNDTPVRDLKKAIGVNDRYVFINELFRGDEVMYERSLKTINGFRILPEAEYWMQRELKVKLGWDENRQTTRHFYQLVKRRFS